METAYQLPPELRQLLVDGHLRRISDTEYSIDALTHDVLGGSGWFTHVYTLHIEPREEEAFTIMAESREHGNDCVLCTADADEVEWWVLDRIKEKDDGN